MSAKSDACKSIAAIQGVDPNDIILKERDGRVLLFERIGGKFCYSTFAKSLDAIVERVQSLADVTDEVNRSMGIVIYE